MRELRKAKSHFTAVEPIRGVISSVVRASGWVLVGTIVSRVIAFIGSVILARLLSPVCFGQLAVIQSTGVLAAGLISGGLAITATHFVAVHREASRESSIRFGVSALMLALCAGTLGTLAVLFLAGPISTQLLADASIQQGLALSSLYIVFSSVSGVAVGALYGLNEFRQATLITVLRAALMILFQVSASVQWGMEGAVVGLVASEGAVVLYVGILIAWLVRKERWTGPWWPTWNTVRELLGFSLPALLASAATQPALWLTGVLLVQEPGGFAAMALFNVADRYRQMIVFLPSTLSPIALSYLSSFHGQGNTGGFRIILWWNVIATVAFAILPMVLLLTFAREAMGLYGPDYVGGETTLMILTCSSVFVALNNVFGQSLVSTGRIWWRCAFDIVLAAALVGSGWLLMPALMAEGLAWAHLIGFGVVTIGLGVSLRWLSSGLPSIRGRSVIQEMPG